MADSLVRSEGPLGRASPSQARGSQRGRDGATRLLGLRARAQAVWPCELGPGGGSLGHAPQEDVHAERGGGASLRRRPWRSTSQHGRTVVSERPVLREATRRHGRLSGGAERSGAQGSPAVFNPKPLAHFLREPRPGPTAPLLPREAPVALSFPS